MTSALKIALSLRFTFCEFMTSPYHEVNSLRPLQNAPFCPISASGGTSRQRRGLNFNPRNIKYIPVVKIFAFPRSKSGIFDLTLTKIEHFSKVSVSVFTLKDVHGDVN